MNKFALVTGGSRGIGRAICLKLARMGYHILVNYNASEAEARKTVDLIKEAGSVGELLKFNVADQSEVDTVLGGWIEKNQDKYIEVLVNNAGITALHRLSRAGSVLQGVASAPGSPASPRCSVPSDDTD